MPRGEAWRYIIPKFHDENLWEKISIVKGGLLDLTLHWYPGNVTFNAVGFSTVSLERKIGEAQIYRNYKENLLCYACYFFDEPEPQFLMWFKINPGQPLETTGMALKGKGGKEWISIKPPEKFIIDFDITKKQIDIFRCVFFNALNNIESYSVIFKRQPSD